MDLKAFFIISFFTVVALLGKLLIPVLTIQDFGSTTGKIRAFDEDYSVIAVGYRALMQ